MSRLLLPLQLWPLAVSAPLVICLSTLVIPAQAGIQTRRTYKEHMPFDSVVLMDSRLRGNDECGGTGGQPKL